MATVLAAVLALVLLSASVATAIPSSQSQSTTLAAQSDPDDNGRGPDRGNGPDDDDDNNGCGNDDDRDDDNEGKCGKYPPKKPKPPKDKDKDKDDDPDFTAMSGGGGAMFAMTTSPLAEAGTEVGATGSGWLADSEVQVSIVGDDGQAENLGAIPVDATGEFSDSVALPADLPAGAQPLTVSGTDAQRRARTEEIPLVVTLPATTIAEDEPGTVITVGVAGLALVVVAMAGTVAIRRRRMADNHFGR